MIHETTRNDMKPTTRILLSFRVVSCRFVDEDFLCPHLIMFNLENLGGGLRINGGRVMTRTMPRVFAARR
jgi:hypothetical protein